MDAKLLLQLAGVALGLLYLWLEYRADIRLWAVGIVMPVVHGVLYYRSGLYADCSMQVYYVLAGLYGWMRWRQTSRRVAAKENAPQRKPAASGTIVHTPWRQVPLLVAAYAALHFLLWFVLTRFTDSTVPFWDAFTTALCVVAYWMLSRRQAEQWLVWLAVDLTTVALYAYKGIPITAGLYLLYSLLAVAGYVRWLRQIPKEAV